MGVMVSQCGTDYVYMDDVAVTYWYQVYHQSEEGYQHWRRSGMADRFAYEKSICMAAKHQFQPLATRLKRYLDMNCCVSQNGSCKAGVLGCTSSPTILFMCWKENFPNEDATRFD